MTRQRRREQEAEMEKALRGNEETYIEGLDKKSSVKTQKEQKMEPKENVIKLGMDSNNSAKSIIKESTDVWVNQDTLDDSRIETKIILPSRIP